MCKYCDPHSNDCCIYSDSLTKEWDENIETYEWDDYDDEFVHYKNCINYCPYCGRKLVENKEV